MSRSIKDTYDSGVPATGASSGIYRIERCVVVEAVPAEVQAELAQSVWWPSLTIEPRGSGTAVAIAASVAPVELGRQIEEAVLLAVLRLGRHPIVASGELAETHLTETHLTETHLGECP